MPAALAPTHVLDAVDTIDALLDLLDLLDDGRRLYRLQGPGPIALLKVQAWSLRESMNEPWQLELVCLAGDARLDLDAMLHQRVSLFSRLADGSEVERSGVVLEARAEDADGGLARYRLHVAPWLALLAYGTHSRVFQDRSTRDIVDAVFAAYPGAQWRWADDVDAHLARSPKADAAHARGARSCCVQYRESDLAFVSRLLAEEGLNLRFDESDRHGVVLFADSTRIDNCPDDDASASAAGGAGLRFHRDAQVEEQDVILSLGATHTLPVHTITTLGWDDTAKRVMAASVPTLARVGSGHAPQLEAYEPAGASPYAGNTGAARAAELMQQAHEARHETWIGTGTVRSFTAGRSFALRQSPLDVLDALTSPGGVKDARRFVLTGVTHAGINNLPQQASDMLVRLGMGIDNDDPWSEPVFPAWVDADLLAQAARSGYANRFEAVSQHVPWRPVTHDGHGLRLDPKPTAQPQIATVVGPNGEATASGADEIHMDRLGRVRIQYAFQRQGGGGTTTNNATSSSSTWVRVLQRWAGAGVGMQWIPRIGQEVLVDFFDGDIDRPYVLGALYTGRGEGGVPATPGGRSGESDTSAFGRSSDHNPSAQGNLTGGHSPAWHGASAHALDAKGQANAAALSGFKSKEFGGAGFSQLVFDDTDSQLRVQLATTQHATQLNLGHLIHQADNHRGGLRGQGFELRTDAYGAIRAKQGVLLSTYATQPHEPAGDNTAALALHGQLEGLSKAVSDAARTHQTVELASHVGSVKANASIVVDTLPPTAAVTKILRGMVSRMTFDQALNDARDHATATGPDRLPHTSEAVITMAGAAGIHQVAGQHIEAAANDTITLAAGQDVHHAVGGATRIHTGQAIGVLAGAVKAGDQAAGKGITAIAGKGDIDIQAQSDTLQIAAKDDVSIQSQSAHIDWAAAKKITLATEGGASIVIEGGNITVMCPGTITVKAGTKSFVAPAGADHAMPKLPQGDGFVRKYVVRRATDRKPIPRQKYRMTLDDGRVIEGITSAEGETCLAESDGMQQVTIELLYD